MKRVDMKTACCGRGASGIARSLALAGMMTGLCDAEGKRKFFDAQDGWLDLSEFIEHPMGFIPMVVPITEPAIGYGGAFAPVFIRPGHKPATGETERPQIWAAGGMMTENGTEGLFGMYKATWGDNRLETLIAGVGASVNLDFHGIGDDPLFDGDPMQYNLDAVGGVMHGRYRVGESDWWLGARYVRAQVDASFVRPAGFRDIIPERSFTTDVGGMSLLINHDTFNNIFTPSRGHLWEFNLNFYDPAFGADGTWQIWDAVAIHYWSLPACCPAKQEESAAGGKTAGMVLINAGSFMMGSEQAGARHNERPEHPVAMDAFWIDAKDVTNADFARFVSATGYKTTAERPVDWEQLKKSLPSGTPKPADEMLKPGSMVFTPPDGPVDLRNMNQWWQWVQGADWQHPKGPGSDIKGLENHPVVQVSWDDAVAYAKWAGKRLPTEAEWEYAAKGGLKGARYAWGNELVKDGKALANTWTGEFPNKNTAEDGFPGTSPVGSFPANGYGLYDMGGNVWNWCSDWYRPDTHARLKLEVFCHNPEGPTSSLSVGHPHQTEERVTKGGSFLCHPAYCESYRPSARRGTPPDTGMSHIGFRCALSTTKQD